MIEVLAISSHVVRGRVGLRAIAPALEAFGIVTHLLPTITLPWHPGRGSGSRVVNQGFTELVDDVINSDMLDQLSAILTGFFANPDQVEKTAELVRTARKTNPSLIYLCDPVLGDAGRLYVSDEVAEAIKTHLVPLADIVTPNAFELEYLSGQSVKSAEDAMAASAQLKPKRREVLATSVPTDTPNLTSLVATTNLEGAEDMISVEIMKHERFESAPNGTGDLLSGVYLALRLSGLPYGEALSATTFVAYEIVAIANQLALVELPIEQALVEIIADLGLFDEEDELELDDDLEPAPNLH